MADNVKVADNVIEKNKKFTETELTGKIKELAKVQSQVADIHADISQNWKALKSREWATIESAIRGIGNDLDRLNNALPKINNPKAKTDGGNAFSKPQG